MIVNGMQGHQYPVPAVCSCWDRCLRLFYGQNNIKCENYEGRFETFLGLMQNYIWELPMDSSRAPTHFEAPCSCVEITLNRPVGCTYMMGAIPVDHFVFGKWMNLFIDLLINAYRLL